MKLIIGDRQTVGSYTGDFGTAGNYKLVFQPHQGRDLIVYYPNDTDGNPQKADIFEERDGRVALGTYTLNNRGLWEDLTLNDSMISSNINPKSIDFEARYASEQEFQTPDGSIILPLIPAESYSNFGDPYSFFSIDALPYKIRKDENNNNVYVPLVVYHDKELHTEDYYGSTEGNVRLKIFLKSGNRDNTNKNIRNYEFKPDRSDLFRANATRTFDYIAESNQAYRVKAPHGFFMMNLNWGDDSEVEHNTTPFHLSVNSVFEHEYKKPGFYKITGMVFYARDIKNKDHRHIDSKVFTWESFESFICINPSDEYDDGLYNINNFCTIGGMNTNSVFFNHLKQNSGYNSDQSLSDQDRFNELDKINMLDTIAKFDSSLLTIKDNDLLEQYTIERDGELRDLNLEEIEDTEEEIPIPIGAFNTSVVGINRNPERAGQPSTPYIEMVEGELPRHWVWTEQEENLIVEDEGLFKQYRWIDYGQGMKAPEINFTLDNPSGQGVSFDGDPFGTIPVSNIPSSFNNDIQESAYAIYGAETLLMMEIYTGQGFLEQINVNNSGLENGNGIVFSFGEDQEDLLVNDFTPLNNRTYWGYRFPISTLNESTQATLNVEVTDVGSEGSGNESQLEDDSNYFTVIEYNAYVENENGGLDSVSLNNPFINLSFSSGDNSTPPSGVGDTDLYDNFSQVPNVARTFSAFATGGESVDDITYTFERWIIPDEGSTAGGSIIGNDFNATGNFRATSEGILVVGLVFAEGGTGGI